MKLILLILSMMFFLTSCEETDSPDTTNPINSFKKVESLLFESDENSNNYLTINNIDSISGKITVETYYETPAVPGKSNQLIQDYYCDSESCETKTVDNTYYKINSSDNSKVLTIERYGLNGLGSMSTYNLIENQ